LKTLAFSWAFRKRAFSLSGQFRKQLIDLIRTMRSSNKNAVQISLCGEILPGEKFIVVGFVPIDVIGLTKDIWFKELNFGRWIE
jgi:hypothetical protein